MTLIELGSLGEFFGAIAVFATLLFLAMQIRFARRTAEDTAVVMRSQGMREILFKLSEDPDSSAAYARCLQMETGALRLAFDRQDADALRFLNLCLASLVTLQSSWQTDRSVRGQRLTESRLRWQFEQPGTRLVWEEFREVHFYADFREFVDALIEELGAPAVPVTAPAKAA